MNKNKNWGTIALAVILPVVAVFVNHHQWTKEDPFYSESWPRAIDVLMLLLIAAYVVAVAMLVQRRRREHLVRNVYFAVAFWFIVPAAATQFIWNADASGHDWLMVSWKWTLKPLPIEVPEAMGWKVPNVPVGLIEGATLVGLQLTTVALLLSSVAIAIDEFRKQPTT